MPLNLIQLETFRRLAAEQNFTRTAELLDITQPAVTQHVRALQAHFRVKLVDQAGRRTVLTDAGRFLAARAEALLGNAELLEREMREFADVCAGELRIGATVTIGTYALPDLIARFRTAFPKIMLHVDVQNTATIARAVAEGRVSLALVEGPLDDENLEIRSYADDELVPIVPLTHPFAKKRRRVSVRDLAPEPFIFREQGSGTRVQVEEALRACGVTPNVVLTLPTGEGIVRAVELGIGVSIVSTLIADGAVRGGRIARVKLHDLELLRTFRAVRLRRQTPSPAARAFTALLPSAGA